VVLALTTVSAARMSCFPRCPIPCPCPIRRWSGSGRPRRSAAARPCTCYKAGDALAGAGRRTPCGVTSGCGRVPTAPHLTRPSVRH